MRIPFFGRRSRRSYNWEITNSAELAEYLGTLSKSKVGETVNAVTAIASNALAACLAVRARTMASLPPHLYERMSDGTRSKAREHPSFAMMAHGPNPLMTWAQFMRWREGMILLAGNAYMQLVWRRGYVVEMWPVQGRIVPRCVDRKLFYEFWPSEGGYDVLSPRDVIHFKSDFLTFDGLQGRSLVDVAREAIGLDIAAEEFTARVLSNGTHMGVVLSTDNVLTTEQFEQARKQIADGQGVAPAGKARVFQNGLKPIVLGMTVKDAELSVLRRYTHERISAIAGVPLVKINDLTHGTYSNTEQQDLAYAKDLVVSNCTDVEQTLDRAWFHGSDVGRFYTKLDLRGLLRGDFKTQMEGFEIGQRIGVWSPNQILEWLDEDGYEGGDVRVMQMQMMPVQQLGQTLDARMRPVVTDATERIRLRAEQDRERGREVTETRAFADKVLAPVRAAYDLAGLVYDHETAVAAAIGEDDER